MKKLLLFSVLSIFLFSCSSDDDASIPDQDPMVGTWLMTAYEVVNPYDLNGDGVESRNVMAETNCYQNETIQLNADGNGLAVSNSFLTVLAAPVGTTDQVAFTLNCEDEVDEFSFTWSVDGNVLTIVDTDGETITADLTSENQFSFTVEDDFQIFIPTVNVVFEEDVVFTFTKQ